MLLSSAVQADQNFNVFLGGQQLGWLRYSGADGNARLTSLFDSTPLGVFDGSYEGESRQGAGGTQYMGKSLSSNKNREVEIRADTTGRVTEVVITPQKDRTALSDPAVLPLGVLDPVAGFGRLLAQNTCPEAFELYDGRRVIQVTPGKSSMNDGVLSCLLDYKVVQGKGHLSPIYIKEITINMEFDPAIAKDGPSLLTLRSGIFAVSFRRD